MKFSRTVEVDDDGTPEIGLSIGDGDDQVFGAPYVRGSSSDTLVFEHEVQAQDIDTDGISLDSGQVNRGGEVVGLGAGGAITDEDDYNIHPLYQGFSDNPMYKVDGRPHVISIAVTSTPPNGAHYRIVDEIEITTTFDQNLSLDPTLSIPLTIGDGFDAETWTADYSSDSEDNKLIFTHRVGAYQRDDDGISISAGSKILGEGTTHVAGTTVKASRDIPELPDQAGHKVYGFLPVVSSNTVTSTPASGDPYRAGETIEVSLTFQYEVEVEETPTIRILVGETGNQRHATYCRARARTLWYSGTKFRRRMQTPTALR